MPDEINNPLTPEYWAEKRRRAMLQQTQAAADDAMRAIEADARIDRGPRMATGKKLTDEQRQIAIDNFRKFLEYEKAVKQRDLGSMAGLSGSVTSELLRGCYKGDVDAAIAKVESAVDGYLRSKDAPAGSFIATALAKRIHAIMRMTAKQGAMAALYCPSGCGKTMALEAAMQLDFRNGLLVKVNVGRRSPFKFTCELLRQILRPRGVPDNMRALADAFNLIDRQLRNSRRLIAVDEADGLPAETFDVIRQIHDVTGCPVLFAGRPNLARKLDRTVRCDEIGGSVRGRICIERDLMAGYENSEGGPWLFSVPDVIQILRQYKVRFDPEVARWLCLLANISACADGRELGALRYAVYVFRVAITIAERRDRPAVTMKDVRASNGMNRDPAYAAQLAHQVDELMTKVGGRDLAAVATG